jgi:hypothetical protein
MPWECLCKDNDGGQITQTARTDWIVRHEKKQAIESKAPFFWTRKGDIEQRGMV